MQLYSKGTQLEIHCILESSHIVSSMTMSESAILVVKESFEFVLELAVNSLGSANDIF